MIIVMARARSLQAQQVTIDTGTVRLEPDRDRPRAFMLYVNGVESSHLDLDDPAWLEFEYLRWMATVVLAEFEPEDRLDVLHLGAAGCSLARSLLAQRPRSRHLAVEIDGRLAELVRDWFDLPRAPALRIRVGEARAVTESLAAGSREVVVRDVFARDRTPAPLITMEFARQVRRVLRPGGWYLVNCADSPALDLARDEAATLRAVFPTVLVIADPPMLKGRRRGNVVFACTDHEVDVNSLSHRLRGGPAPAGLWGDATVRDFGRHHRPLSDDDPDFVTDPSEDPDWSRRPEDADAEVRPLPEALRTRELSRLLRRGPGESNG